MKTTKNYFKITLGVFLLTTGIAFANNNDPIVKKKKNASAEVIMPVSALEWNKEYVTEVHENSSQYDAKFLSGKISEWDVRNSAKFDSSKGRFTVNFKSNKGYAKVTYNEEGSIIKVQKYLKNVRIPIDIQKQVSEKYGDWLIVQTKYNVSYEVGNDVEKSYVLTLKNESGKKKIRMKV